MGLTKPGDVAGLDPEGTAGESQRLLRLLAIGWVELPPLGSSDKDHGVALDLYDEGRLTRTRDGSDAPRCLQNSQGQRESVLHHHPQ
jgi:hypothetical protein